MRQSQRRYLCLLDERRRAGLDKDDAKRGNCRERNQCRVGGVSGERDGLWRGDVYSRAVVLGGLACGGVASGGGDLGGGCVADAKVGAADVEG